MMLSATSCLHLLGLPLIGDLDVSGSEFCGSVCNSCGVPLRMTGVVSAHLVLVPSAEASVLVHGSWVGLDRSSFSFAFTCRSVAAFALIGLFPDISAAAAVPAHPHCLRWVEISLHRGPQLDCCRRNVLQGS